MGNGTAIHIGKFALGCFFLEIWESDLGMIGKLVPRLIRFVEFLDAAATFNAGVPGFAEVSSILLLNIPPASGGMSFRNCAV